MGTSSVGLLRLCGFYLKVPCLALDAPWCGRQATSHGSRHMCCYILSHPPAMYLCSPSDAPSRTRFPMACQLKSLLGAAALLFAALLSGCGGGSSDTGANPPPTATGSATLLRIAAEAPGGNCAAGGVRIQSGMDIDANGVLADSEVSSTQYVCNGTSGANAGTGSTNGLSTLVRLRPEPAGTPCAQGGSAVLAGLDANRNGLLEDNEITSTSYVCNGAAGAPGGSGPAGSAGHDSLLSLTPESPGANCAYGGQRVQSGLDRDNNGVLSVGEVTSTSYLCSAAPADTQWVNVTGTAVQAVSNTGYLANNPSAKVVITLPTAPTIGDWIKVTGVGSGGWTIAQNAGQRIATRSLAGGMNITWTPQALTGSWTAVAVSADGTRQVAASSSGELYTSTNSGTNWTLRLTGQAWSGAATSSDGTKITAVTNGGSIYRSTDGGATWSNDGSSRAWSAVASSADGSRLVATAYLGTIWTSSDGGASWTSRDSNRAWRAVSSSSDGRVLVAATNGVQLYVSTDYGVTWVARASAQFWWGVASTADGQRLYASVDTGAIWSSSDYGTTWESVGANRDWRGIATSSDGRFVVAATSGGTLYESSDFGATWRSTASTGSWNPVASSSDGLTLLAGNSGSALYTGSRRSSTTPGVAGSLSGGPEDALQLQYVGAGVFMPISYVLANPQFSVQ